MKVFDDIAIHCRLEQSFGLKKPGTAMRTRFTNLVNQYKADQCQSMRKSGTTEEYAEREQRGIERSGELLRSLAMGEIAFDEEEELDFALDSSRSGEDSGEATDAATSGRKNKITKRERLDVVSNGITSALLEASEDEKAKYQYKMQRLQFEREQEDQKRVHGAAEAEKRRAHELQLEDRRLQSDAARDKRMQEFILKVLEQQKQ
ncbi:uncharacterized protein PITG_08385 [Phytophthora infestans T30-4]|uniref:Uncharacterized protein n=1 Tax=Phytophthora infestans (strain T30-4) TaxID=403677 RepID=D0NAG8_PHYIT|nr:uncharacterized protein PITG_08385 [Phytophthora infestans T30-4]EEY54826.1 conserved hypothetical protein [Phytophthora infestans T30-4]|eukprot:XP_002903771.1 conserved hypothetical protein [Phytophthora infestans T30-4]